MIMIDVDTIRVVIEDYRMLEQNDRVVVGLSGGPDSVALLHILYSFAGEYRLILHVAHLNHMFRGNEAEEDARFVKEFADSLGLPCIVESYDVPAYLRRTGRSPQEGAREVRYDFYRRVARDVGANKVALGHNADDQVETILMRLFRGSGLTGLTAIPPVRAEGDITYIRPLIRASRSEIAAYCEANNLATRLDASNVKPKYLRNKIRLELIPLLEREYNSRIREALLRTADILRLDSDYIEGMAAAAFQDALFDWTEDSVILDCGALFRQHGAIQGRIIRQAVARLRGGEVKDIESEHIHSVLAMARRGVSGASLDMPGGIMAEYEYGKLRLRIETRGAAPLPERPVVPERVLVIPGVTRIPELSCEIEARVLDIGEMPLPREGRKRARGYRVCLEEFLDSDAIPGPLVVRTRRHGDRFRPLGMDGTKKLKEFFIDLKIPRGRRDRIPLIVAGDEIIWVIGYRIGERFKVTGATRKVLHLVARYSDEAAKA
ncbi:MAG: tRNA lysidine(34) synthetase TilS [Firmicutes bacterium]|nr:tRNA lysidine(34) synthetase TilS [Bacillota bacterium]